MKKIIALLISLTIIISLAACGNKSKENTPSKPAEIKGIDMSVACLKGPTGVGTVKLMEDSENKSTFNNYSFTVASAADEISAKIVSGEINIASVPTNLAAKLYAKTNGKIRILAVNTLGVLSIIQDGDSIKSVADLKGETIYSTGEGSNPEYILKHLLKKNGIDPENDVKINFVATNDELVAALVSSNARVAMVPEPAATTVLSKKDTLKRVISVNDEWKKISSGELMMGCVVALDSFIKENGEQVNKFLEEYENSVNFAKASVEKAAELCEKYEIIPSASVAKNAIPLCNLTFIKGEQIKIGISDYFEVLLSFDPSSIGGAVPNDDFYYVQK